MIILVSLTEITKYLNHCGILLISFKCAKFEDIQNNK